MYPHLSHMALDYLFIPSMRIFLSYIPLHPNDACCALQLHPLMSNGSSAAANFFYLMFIVGCLPNWFTHFSTLVQGVCEG